MSEKTAIIDIPLGFLYWRLACVSCWNLASSSLSSDLKEASSSEQVIHTSIINKTLKRLYH